MGLTKQFMLEQIEGYRCILREYEELLISIKKMMVNPRTSESKRHACKSLILEIESEKRKCSENIRRLLNE